MYRALLIILSVCSILIPFSGLPGGVEDVVMQVAAFAILLLVLLLPKRETKKIIEEPKVPEDPYGL